MHTDKTAKKNDQKNSKLDFANSQQIYWYLIFFRLQTGFEELYDAIVNAFKKSIESQKSLSKKYIEESKQESVKNFRILASKEYHLNKLQKELKEEREERRLVRCTEIFFLHPFQLIAYCNLIVFYFLAEMLIWERIKCINLVPQICKSKF